ncbi:MAG: hypothetical protein IPM24_07015 [Bryobacterales bacterium]|nr:hypothetical protein [Bryobacterales bacterium]
MQDASVWWKRLGAFSRRALFGGGGLAALVAAQRPAPAQGTALKIGPDIYKSIGVRPLINCRGTLTIIGGSLELDPVRQAKEAAALQFVHLDELADAVGERLAQLTGAEFGVVTSGCAAGLTHATAACVAGGNPDLHVRIPNLAGFPKDEVIIPTHSRNVYDAAVRAVGVRVLEVETLEQLESALGPRTAMIYIFAGPRAETGPLAFEIVTKLAKDRNVPVLVDAAAEVLTVPNVHLQRGATLVGYSGGKCLRGPQCAGMILGRKDLVRAAWVHSAPHHGFARGMKVGKEEVLGMLAAVEAWVHQRDHKAEWNRWMGWLDHIAKEVSKIEGVTTSVREPQGLSNRTPSLSIRWDTNRIGIDGQEVSRILFTTEPRIALGGGGFGRRGAQQGSETSISVTAYMMSPGDEEIVARRVREVLQQAPRRPLERPQTQTAAGDVSGRWNVEITFLAGKSTHVLHLRQAGNRIEGTHQGDFVSRDLRGTIDGDTVTVASSQTERFGDSLQFRFTGKLLSGDTLSGDLDMGEYRTAKFTARRHQSRGA